MGGKTVCLLQPLTQKRSGGTVFPVTVASALVVPFAAVVDKLRIKIRLGSNLLCRMNARLFMMICFDFETAMVKVS